MQLHMTALATLLRIREYCRLQNCIVRVTINLNNHEKLKVCMRYGHSRAILMTAAIEVDNQIYLPWQLIYRTERYRDQKGGTYKEPLRQLSIKGIRTVKSLIIDAL